VPTDNGRGASHQPVDGIGEVGGPEGVAALVRSLAAIMRDGGVTKLDLSIGSLSIKLRGKSRVAITGGMDQADGMAIATSEPQSVPEHIITAPMIGTYYASPSPGARPFVEVGDTIKTGQVVGIIEAMKIMNEILADQPGEIVAILASNGQPVEYGSPLILLAPSEDQ
jgi:acetyl-CoA carboxylase biotin carboxyl carrier protein